MYFEGRVRENVSKGLNCISYNCLSNITNVINITSMYTLEIDLQQIDLPEICLKEDKEISTMLKG